jgi:maltose alpha-D-glucosyltransferase/alpha-amylase
LSEPGHWFESEPLWFKRAVFYEIHIRGFFDGNGDGSGDFRGLIEKLDFLQWLGIDCIWLLPMYPSPLRDGGYDIADFYAIHPDYGTVEDFRAFVEEAHSADPRDRRPGHEPHLVRPSLVPGGELRSRLAQARLVRVVGHRRRWPEARIIFVDTEPSNWTWDPIAGQYYWHRFFSHQPDLNYDNPEVQERCSTCCASGSTSGSTASGSTPCRISSSATARTAENLDRDARVPQARPG